jgi:MFS family permease
VTTAEPAAPPASPARIDDPTYRRRLLVTVLSALIVFSSSMTIVSASLPTMADDLDSDEAILSWGVTGLFLAMAVATPVMGRLGDTYGHRKVFLCGSAVLAFGTGLCGLAPTDLAFIGARMIVGLGISATMPNAMALIMGAYPVDERVQAMGWFQMVMTGAPVLGLVIGGPLIEAFGWRAVFALLTPLGIAGFLWAWRVIRPTPPGPRVPVDYAGAATLALATLAFLLGLERGRAAGFGDPICLALLVLTPAALAAFILIERRARFPMLKLSYFRRPNFTGPLIAQPLGQFAYMGGFLISPILLDDVFGLGVGAIALVLLFRPGAYSLSSPVGGRLAVRLGNRLFVILGSVLMTASMVVFAGAAANEHLGLFIAALVLSGLAMGLASPSYSTSLANAVDPHDLGIASGMGSTMMNIGMLTGIQAMFVVLGDGRAPDDFARTYLFGGAVAAISVVGGLIMRPERRGAVAGSPDAAWPAT